ncbi:M16 family metallopeptidase [Hylemonella sp. W303a]|uniref:M16 family metallopeptidase n=1 Tax=Hylemonella sp. W303a TaxID=3389873 RepID=UPI00396B457E
MNMMHNTFVARLLAALLGGWAVASAHAAIPIQHWTQPEGPGQGAQVWLIESPAVPMVDVRLEFDGGGRRDPADRAGLAEAGTLMMGKGVRDSLGKAGREPALDENALGEAWADLGAMFGGDDTTDRVSFSLRSLTDTDLLQRAAALAARVLAEPSWPEAVWARERERMQAALRESLTRPATVASRAYQRAVFGVHPYGQAMTDESLARISLVDLQAWHGRTFLACRAKVSIVGAVNRAQAQELTAQLLARLPRSRDPKDCPSLPPVPEVAPLDKAADLRIPFDAAQAQVFIGQPGFKRDDPDYFALTVGNYILGGGGFVSRLTEEVREKRGLSYSVYSYFNPGLHAGSFSIGLQTRPDQAEAALKVAREVLARFLIQGPTEAELKAAKANLIGGFALRIDSNRKLIDNLANIAAHDLPLDYLDSWTEQVNKVTVADIRAAFARKLRADRMVTVVLGGK